MSQSVVAASRSTRRTGRAGWLADPAIAFAAIALVAGIVLMFAVPPFAGNDESGHFARNWQLSSGRPIPVESTEGSPPGGGACLPVEVAAEVQRRGPGSAYGVPVDGPAPAGQGTGCDDPDEQFVEFATFAWYTPLGYVPSAAGVGIGRLTGVGLVGIDRLGRLVGLLAFVAVAAFAIRRAPGVQWGLAAVGLLPVTLFQAATSLSPDGLTIAFAMAVVSSALRMATDPERPLRACLVEGAALSVLLALSKPTYGVVAFAYLVPAIGPGRRGELWRMVFPAGGAVALALLWQRIFEHLWLCDLRLFDLPADPRGQVEEIVSGPHRFVAGLARATVESAGGWADDLVAIEARVTDWPRWAVLATLAGFCIVTVLRRQGDRLDLHWSQRVVLVVPVVVGLALLFGGWYVYCNPVGPDLVIEPSARLFVPLLPPAVAAAAPGPGARLTPGRGEVWIAAALAAFAGLWVASVVSQMN